MTGSGRLPDFLVIGAVKAATTWINAQLQAHPDIFMPGPEPHFFSTEFDRGLDYYHGFFRDAGGAQMIGEKSADYLAHPQAPARIAAMLPGAQLVVQFRHPVDRAYSDYRMLYRRGTIKGPPEQYLRPGSEQPRFLDNSLYGRHLGRWFDHMPREQIHPLFFEDVRRSPRETVEAVCRHIGAVPHFAEEVGERPVNDGSASLLPLPLRNLLAPLKASVRPLRGTAGFEKLRSLMAREVDYPPLLPETRARLTDLFATDIQELAALTGRNLDHWLILEAKAA